MFDCGGDVEPVGIRVLPQGRYPAGGVGVDLGWSVGWFGLRLRVPDFRRYRRGFGDRVPALVAQCSGPFPS